MAVGDIVPVPGAHCLIATGVNADGYREILGIGVTSSEDGAGWLAFLRGLAARGRSGVALVTSDDHADLVNVIAAVLPGATWQRCRTHYHRNLLTRVPKTAQPWVSTLVRTIFEQPDPASVRAQHRQVVEAGSQAAAGRRPSRRRPRRHPGVHRLPPRGLAADLDQTIGYDVRRPFPASDRAPGPHSRITTARSAR